MSNKESRNDPEQNNDAAGSASLEDSGKTEPIEAETVQQGDEPVKREVNDREEVAALEAQLAELRNSYLRKVAELENVKKRTERERLQLLESVKIAALEDFLPVYEDLQRTIEAIEESSVDGVSQIEDGVKLIGNKFKEILTRHNVESIDKAGVPFDVNLHDALLRQKAEDEETESDTVLKVLESGYRIGNRTIRHAKVIVSE